MISASLFPLANMFYAFRQSNLPGQMIVFALIVWSIWVWTVMVTKFSDLKKAQLQTKKFIDLFRREQDPVGIYLRGRRFEGSPVYMVYVNGCLALGGELEEYSGGQTGELKFSGLRADDSGLTVRQCDQVRSNVERTVMDQAMLLEERMSVVGTAVSLCPFLGLLGTVWGVMDAFGGMAVAGSATLSAVAPGISGALLTTIVGLLVAIPSAFGYNNLTHRIRRLHVEMDNFSQEFMSTIQRTYLAE